jgi:hypothetical protein
MGHTIPVSDPSAAQRLADAAEDEVLAAHQRRRRLAALLSPAVTRADADARLDRALRSLC